MNAAPRRRSIVLLEQRCTSCMICARECPAWCIHVEAHQERTPGAGPGGRTLARNVLDRFAIDWGRCLFCGACVDGCPHDALEWSDRPLPAAPHRGELTHERARLAPSAGNSDPTPGR